MKATVVAVGNELLLGDVVNSNAAVIGRALRDCGIEVVSSVVVPDDIERAGSAIRAGLVDADLVVLCGGLGPTLDDLTREAIAWACDRPLERDAAIERRLQALFSGRGEVPEEVYRQADVPRGAEALRNTMGTAPGLWLEQDGKIVVALPGPPRELAAVAPTVWARLAERSGEGLITRQVLVAGLGESAVAARLRELAVPAGVRLSFLAGSGVVRVRYTGRAPAELQSLVDQACRVLGKSVFGLDTDTLDGVVHDLLASRGQTVAVAESLTGGLLAAALTSRPGSSETFRGGLVPYATDLKHSLAGVPEALLASEGAVSAASAAALAAGARDRLGAQWGVATTGVAGPTTQQGHPVGTVFLAVAGPGVSEVRQLHLPGERSLVREATVVCALDLLRRVLAGYVEGDG